MVAEEIGILHESGIRNVNIDLIAGLSGQTAASWRESLDWIARLAPEHVSVYMLEVDEDSRLGKEMMLGGVRYGAADTPGDDETATFYEKAVERLAEMGIARYEISNFARAGFESRHNLKYWQRKPYFGFGVDAHSMLPAVRPDLAAVRFAAVDDLNAFVAGAPLQVSEVTHTAATEEAFFLGLRLVEGVNLQSIAAEFGKDAVASVAGVIDELVEYELLQHVGDQLSLTAQGRLLSNEVFERFIGVGVAPSSRV
jgi:oxygen-independent coproporphyrinogen-3 oxidase